MEVFMLAVGLVLPRSPGAVSFAPGLLKPIPTAKEALQRVRSSGTRHLAAVSSYMVGRAEDTEADLLAAGALDALLNATETVEPTGSPEIFQARTAKEWVHVCSTVEELAGAKRVGARTVWLNAAAAADEHSVPITDEDIARAQAAGLAEPRGYVARGIIADLADAVCAELAALPEALVALQAAHLAKSDPASAARAPWEPEPAEPAATAGGVGLAGPGRPRCIACGAELLPEAKFCAECGQSCDLTVIQ